MPDEQKIREIVRQEIRSNQGRNEYRVNDVPFHTHNGTDSPFAYNPYNVYVGLIQEDSFPLILPSGWTVDHVSTGIYNINHNLGTDLYVMTVSPILSITIPVASVIPDENFTQVTWFNADSLSPGFVDTTFQFILAQISLGVQNVPQYTRNNQNL